VELAQHQYLLPRLAGQWTHLERLGGGIGTRGPGESQLETDRRIIRQRIARLRQDIEEVRQRRALHRANRRRRGAVMVSLVGYTNAGKSTLMNALTHADVLVQDRLFATLDPVTRQLRLAGGTDILISDTVGFIQKLPTMLVAAFRATLEELEDADILLHVVDVSDPNAQNQRQTVNETLDGLGLKDKPQILVLNKVDKVKLPARTDGYTAPDAEEDDLVEGWQPPVHPYTFLLTGPDENTVFVSALNGQGLDVLVQRIRARAAQLMSTAA
jgi:GTP-binding protein HflX